MEIYTDKEKIEQILLDDNVVEAINKNIDYLIDVIPEISYMINFEHKNPHHYLDVWNHTLYALSLSEKDIDIRLALLLHDIGKPFSFQEVNGIRHYKNHPLMSYKMSEEILKRLNYDEKYIEKICYLIKNHDLPITKEDISINRNLEIKRLKIQKCDTLAHNPNEKEQREKYINKVLKLFD